jgi:hypothetical protein
MLVDVTEDIKHLIDRIFSLEPDDVPLRTSLDRLPAYGTK